MRFCVLIFLIICIYCGKSQTVINLDTISLPAATENLYNKALFSDSLASSFYIVIKKEVKPHKHQRHCEQIYVLEGEGTMRLEDKFLKIKKGDLVYIPKNSVHAVKTTGVGPLKVISIQAPYFDGKDRIFIETK